MGKPANPWPKYPEGDYYWFSSRWIGHVVVVHFSHDGRVVEAFND
jgi:hypothetical protein